GGKKTALHSRCDNSANNPAQPSKPPKSVRWGEQTTDEMAIVFYQVLIDPGVEDWFRQTIIGHRGRGAAATATPPKDSPAREGLMKRLLERFDKNNDGKLD